MHISKECNEKFRAEYEMSNKQWEINEIISEKAKTVINFLELRSSFSSEFESEKMFRAKSLNRSEIVRSLPAPILLGYKKTLGINIWLTP